MKILAFTCENHEHHQNLRIPLENHENYTNHMIALENNKNHETLKITKENNKIRLCVNYKILYNIKFKNVKILKMAFEWQKLNVNK